jgi:hypothetical protein
MPRRIGGVCTSTKTGSVERFGCFGLHAQRVDPVIGEIAHPRRAPLPQRLPILAVLSTLLQQHEREGGQRSGHSDSGKCDCKPG